MLSRIKKIPVSGELGFPQRRLGVLEQRIGIPAVDGVNGYPGLHRDAQLVAVNFKCLLMNA